MTGGIKRTKTDAVWSDLVRERADWSCEVCGKEFPDRKGAGLHCSHFFGRRGASTRHHGDNCYAQCFACHQRLGSNPHDFRSWVFKQLGETRYDDLVLRANKPRKYSKAEKKERLEHFEAQLRNLKKRRANGELGYIEFVDWD
jgi:tRNA U54 and U55 pseudouridine synthase Pus10